MVFLNLLVFLIRKMDKLMINITIDTEKEEVIDAVKALLRGFDVSFSENEVPETWQVDLINEGVRDYEMGNIVSLEETLEKAYTLCHQKS
jgi:hypothetical protein